MLITLNNISTGICKLVFDQTVGHHSLITKLTKTSKIWTSHKVEKSSFTTSHNPEAPCGTLLTCMSSRPQNMKYVSIRMICLVVDKVFFLIKTHCIFSLTAFFWYL